MDDDRFDREPIVSEEPDAIVDAADDEPATYRLVSRGDRAQADADERRVGRTRRVSEPRNGRSPRGDRPVRR